MTILKTAKDKNPEILSIEQFLEEALYRIYLDDDSAETALRELQHLVKLMIISNPSRLVIKYLVDDLNKTISYKIGRNYEYSIID